MAVFISKKQQDALSTRHERRAGKSGLRERGIEEYLESQCVTWEANDARLARLYTNDISRDPFLMHLGRAEANQMLQQEQSREASRIAEIKGAVKRNNIKALNNPFRELSAIQFMTPQELAIRNMEKEEAVREKRISNLAAGLLPFTPRQILMLLLEEEGKTSEQLAKSLQKVTRDVWKPSDPEDTVVEILRVMCHLGFARVGGKSGSRNLYHLGHNGRDFGQAVAYMSLYTSRLHGIPMTDLWGTTSASPNGFVTAVGRFKMLERLERGDARINELAEIVDPGAARKDTTYSQINALKGLGLVNYTFSEEDLLLLLSPEDLKHGKFAGITKKLSENEIQNLSKAEISKLRICITDEAKEKLGRLIITARSAVRDGLADQKLRSIARKCASDESLGLLVASPMQAYTESRYITTPLKRSGAYALAMSQQPPSGTSIRPRTL